MPEHRSRVIRIVLVTVVGAIVIAGVVFRDELSLVYRQFFPGDALEAAADRTTGPAEIAPGAFPPPSVNLADGRTGADPEIALEQVVELASPSAVVDLAGSGPVLVSTLDGRIHEVDLDTGSSEVVLDLRSVVSTGGERGLLGLAADPDGARLYVDYTNADGDTEIRSWPIADGRPVGAADDGVDHLLIGQPFPNHNGGNLVFGPDDLLWIGTGDGGGIGDPGSTAQDADHLLGKMLRVVPDPDGGVSAPASNPAWDGRPEIWATGLRNPWRYSFDRATNRLWIADVGQSSIEEVTVVDPDASSPNLGWNLLEGTNTYEGEADPALTDPVVEYPHDDACSITGGHVYRGREIPSLYGWYVFGDYCGGWIRAVPADDPSSAITELVPDAGQALSFAEMEDGELLFLTPEGISAIVSAP